MPVHKVVSDGTNIQIFLDSSAPRWSILAANVIGATLETRLAAVKTLAQAGVQTKTLLTDLHPQDPARQSDPARPDWFWDGLGSIVHRPVEVTGVTWDADAGRYVLSLRRLTPDT